MPTFRIYIREHKKGDNRKYRVSIQMIHQRTIKYLPTDVYVSRAHLTKDSSSLKDDFIRRKVDKQIETYEDILLRELGSDLSGYSADYLKRYLINYKATEGGRNIDFVAFAREYIETRKEKDNNYTNTLRTSLDQLTDFAGKEIIYVREITSGFLHRFEQYLRSSRTIRRTNQFGKLVTLKHEGVHTNTIVEYMVKLRVLFNACRKHYNGQDEDRTIISHYPFLNYKIPALLKTKKRNVPGEMIKKIYDSPGVVKKRTRPLMARDVFMLSFLFAGMNTADIYHMEYACYKDGRLTYKRKKTRTRRSDEALISLKIEPEVLPIFEKYLDPNKKRVFKFYKYYATAHAFNAAVNKGLKTIDEDLEIGVQLSTYYARHSWATIARNKCGISRGEVSECLNHTVDEYKMADIYIEKDWAFLDNANRKVIDFVMGQN